jgi:hypothetical protein
MVDIEPRAPAHSRPALRRRHACERRAAWPLALGAAAALTLAVLPAAAEVEDPRAQTGFEQVQPFIGLPFIAMRAILVVPGAALAEGANAIPSLVDRAAPGLFPCAEPGSIWRGALHALRDDWNESTPGLAAPR